MVGVAYDFLANPLGAVRSTFEKAVGSGSDPASFDDKDWGAVDLFRRFLFDDDGLSQVPILNSESIRWIQPNTLVRFRGMVQDMLGNEFYVGAYKDGSGWRTNKFTDLPQFPMDSSPDMRLWERRMLYCIPVPGQNSWSETPSEAVRYRSMDSATQQREKRQRLDVEPTDSMDYDVSDDGSHSTPTKKLRVDGHPSLSAQSQEGTSSSMIVLPDFNKDSLPCLVKLYDCPESDVKLNDVFEFIGVFTFDSEFKVDKDESDDFANGFSEDVLVHLPPNKVPRLHCFIHRKLAVQDFLPRSPTVEPNPNLVVEIREALLRHLTTVLGNDGLAAQFMLLHLLSMVHSRVENVAVGKLSLNLTCFTKESVPVFGTQLGIAIKNLIPFTQYISLTVEYLNAASLAPRKDYETNRLMTGALQLAEGTHLIVDETGLEPGTLNSVGVENTRLLKSVMELQKVEYDFKFYELDMATEVQMLVLSEGKSNILPADIVLPFHPSSVSSSEVAAEALEAWRWYLATLRALPHSIESEMQKVIENDLVAARQEDRSLGTQDFSRLLTMARLMCMSFGETSLSIEHWQMVKELERLRRERLKTRVTTNI